MTRVQTQPDPTTRQADAPQTPLRLALPKGRMAEGVRALLADAGIRIGSSSRGYRPRVSLAGVEAKILKPQNVLEMLDAGSRDLGFAGADWVAELGADVVEVVDTGMDAVRIFAAAPRQILRTDADGTRRLPTEDELGRPVRVASELERITKDWMRRAVPGGSFVRTYGATEVFPPEDADCIVDITQTGATLEANGLEIIDTAMTSSTRLYASRSAWDDPARRARIEDIGLVLTSVLDARGRAVVEINADSDEVMRRIVEILPCMRRPTVARLFGEEGYAIKSVVPRSALAELVPQVKSAGGTDLVITDVAQVVR